MLLRGMTRWRSLFLTITAMAAPVLTSRGGIIFRDSFDAPNTGNLDTSVQTGRRSGSDTAIQLRSSRIQHGLNGGQLSFLNNWSGRLRFHDDPDLNTATDGIWHDWAARNGTEILAAAGLRVEFDWIAGNSSSSEWVGFNAGHNSFSAGEPAYRILDGGTDIGVLFRFDGRTEAWDNGAKRGDGTTLSPVIGLRHVLIDYSFTSFADGSPVSVEARVDGTAVYSGGFTWSGNGGRLFMEIETNENTRLDNVSISTIPRTPLELWRLANFGTPAGTGNAANNADPDKDGLENLVEYAFSLNPNSPSTANLPQWVLDDETYVLTFTQPANVSGVTYTAEYNSTLTPGGWSAAGHAGQGNNHIFFAAATTPRMYLRLRVTAP